VENHLEVCLSTACCLPAPRKIRLLKTVQVQLLKARQLFGNIPGSG
jgi:hypothetical protein